VLLTSNYGEAGAIEVFGPSLGLPRAYSGHNAYGWWGPPPDGGSAVVTVAEDGPPQMLPDCHLVAPVANDEGVRNEESERAAIYLCSPPASGWATVWSRLRHLSS
jgi:hypothetical protein